MADILQVLQAAAFISVILGAIFAMWNLRGFARDRRTRLVLDVFSHASTREFSEQFAKIIDTEFKDSREAEEKCSLVTLSMVARYCEGVGLLIQRRLIDADLAFELLAFDMLWRKMEPWCLEKRRLFGPTVYEYFEYAAKRTSAYVAERARKQAALQ